MHPRMIAEIGGSMVIVAFTGLFMVAGLVLGTYCLLSMNPFSKVLGLILLLVGVENLPIFVLWCRQVAREYAQMTSANDSGR